MGRLLSEFNKAKEQRVEKVFSPRCADFETFKKVSKSCLIERAVGFLPPAHTPRCSVASVFCGVFLQPEEFKWLAFANHLNSNIHRYCCQCVYPVRNPLSSRQVAVCTLSVRISCQRCSFLKISPVLPKTLHQIFLSDSGAPAWRRRTFR